MDQRERNIEGWRKLLANRPAARLPEDVRFFLHKEPTVDLSETALGRPARPAARWLYVAAAALVVVGFGIALGVRSLQFGSDATADMAVEILDVEGQGQIFEVEGRLPRSARKGEQLKPAEVVATGSNTRIDLSLPGGILVRLGPESRYRLEVKSFAERVQVRSFLDTGSIYTIVPLQENPQQSYEVVTPTTIAAVRGTSFRVDTDANQTSVHLIDGSLEVAPRSHVESLPGVPPQENAKGVVMEPGDYLQMDKQGKINRMAAPEAFAGDVLELADLADVAARARTDEQAGVDSADDEDNAYADIVEKVGPDGEMKLNLSDDPEIRRKQIEESGYARTIILVNGKQIKGIVFSQKGDQMYIETAEKTLIIPKSQIKTMIF